MIPMLLRYNELQLYYKHETCRNWRLGKVEKQKREDITITPCNLHIVCSVALLTQHFVNVLEYIAF